MNKVSIIIPVYNVENYLAECLDSIIKQTYNNLEIICVNDASPDRSAKILNDYAQKESRMIVLNHTKNAGLSAARNTGLEVASGKYIYFMDSDDILNHATIRTCTQLSEENSLDLVCFDADVFYDEEKSPNLGLNEKKYNYERAKFMEENIIFTGWEFFVKSVNNGTFQPSVCLNFIKKDVLIKGDLRFYEGIIHEDELFTPELYFYTQKVMYIPEKFYKRRLRRDSIMGKKRGYRNIRDIGLITEKLFELHQTIKIKNKYFSKALKKRIFILFEYTLKNDLNNLSKDQKIKIEGLLSNSIAYKKYIKYKKIKENFFLNLFFKIYRKFNSVLCSPF